MLYHGALMVGSTVLALYNLIVVRFCSSCFSEDEAITFGSSFEYKRNHEGEDSECVVCLSVYEEGEELRQLPKCKHFFHAPCIDTWLNSHVDCPLCRGAVRPPTVERPELVPVTLV